MRAAFLSLILICLASVPSLGCPEEAAKVAGSETCEPIQPCVPVTGTFPFERVLEEPAFETGGCFSVARDAAIYVLLVTVFPGDPNPGFYRSTSADGATWEPLSVVPVFPSNAAWFTGIKCPDLQFRDDGKLHLYFKGQDARDGKPKFGHATSTNLGRSWSIDPEPVFASSETGWEGPIDMPSIVDTGNPGPRRYVMAYFADPPGGPGLTGETGVAFSPDGLAWTKHPGNPVVQKGTDPWNCRVAGRPRLLVAPDGSLHMFYAGTRVCIKVLHAISLDGGVTWDEQTLPVFDLADDPEAWDSSGPLYCTSFAWDPYPDRLQIFYTGAGFQVGLAEASWPLSEPTSVPPDASEQARPARLAFASPNPFRERTVVHNARPGGDGAASIRLHDVSGRLVRLLWAGRGSELPGDVSWDGLGSNGAGVPAGRYLVTTFPGDGTPAR